MSQTLLQLTEACELRSGYNDLTFRPTWRNFLNEAAREFARGHPWPGLEGFTTLVVPSGSSSFSLPHWLDEVISIANVTDILPVDRAGDWDRTATSLYTQNTAGRLMQYDSGGVYPVSRAPVSYLTVVSSSALDTFGSVNISGYVTDTRYSGTPMENLFQNISMTPGGVTPVTFTSLWNQILSISKSTETNGDFYLSDSGSGQPNAGVSYIPRYDTEASFRRLRLLQVPQAATTILIKYRSKVPPLYSNEQSLYPGIDGDYVVHKAIDLFYRFQQQYTKAQIEGGTATAIMQAAANKERNFNEGGSYITPWIPDDVDKAALED